MKEGQEGAGQVSKGTLCSTANLVWALLSRKEDPIQWPCPALQRRRGWGDCLRVVVSQDLLRPYHQFLF